MPLGKRDIFDKIVRKAEGAAGQFKAFGCGVGLPRVVEMLIEAYGLLDSLLDEERSELRELAPTIYRSVVDRRIGCDEVEEILKEAEKFLGYSIRRIRYEVR